MRARPGQSCEHTCATYTHAHTQTRTHTYNVCLADIQTHIQLTLPACRSPTYRHAAEQGLAKAVGARNTQMLTHTNSYAHTMCAWQIFRRTYNSFCLRVVHLPAGMLQSKAWPKLWVHATRVCWAGMHMKWMRGASTCSRGRIFLMVRQLLFPCH